MNAPVTSFDTVSVAVLPPVARFNLRIAPADIAEASQAFGVTLPSRIGGGARHEDRAAYCLGPDEWLLHAAETDQAPIQSAFDGLRATTAHSLTVISDREITIAVAGPAVLDLLATGCPLDLSLMPVGRAKRTVFDYAQVVLIRDGEDAFRLEVWRSFFPHVHGLLEIAAREIAIGL
ncbi:sarcosine oxidase subunit gamma [Paracoccus seriniphilus]|uniref:Sarcosine oxidase subunit gamma n=1 Tax=Paracoccus seriniphilus TaxID=184748 RepID=A0A239Q094_9RHOB|nr:sarcosine oxidase subunit gamma family protein [Paracoccus seriniphilus]WCR15709.1 sarcosine oxidase subunit gamma [Paracoccus seriniphilus]SNT75612.1 sarcosine oxidase subunit gamma [Paracoccus seriniphilus]